MKTGDVLSESYSQKPADRIVRDPGIVPPDKVLVMEGVSEITVQYRNFRNAFHHQNLFPEALSRDPGQLRSRFPGIRFAIAPPVLIQKKTVQVEAFYGNWMDSV